MNPLADDEVHIWCYDLAADTNAPNDAILNPEERERAARFHFPVHRQRFTQTRAMLRKVLAQYLQIAATEIIFNYNEYGKPELIAKQNPLNLQFNLSHSETMALLAVTRSNLIGVDVEYMSRSTDYIAIAERFFAPSEYAKMQNVAPDLIPLSFFHCWTRKEAFIKAIGDGLSYPLDQFEVSLLPEEPAQLLSIAGSASDAAAWTMHSFEPAPGYMAALAVQSLNVRVQFYHKI